jgi:hypothetical protein
MTTTEEIIANQLAENTGRAMMDSGDYYGRAWERNQSRAAEAHVTVLEMFQAQPRAWWDGYGVTLSTFHWMTEHLDYADDMQRWLDRWINLGWIEARHPERGSRYANGPGTNGPGTIDDWLDRMKQRGWAEEHPEFGGWTNTYNHENLLSQDLQFRCFATTDDHPLGEDSFVAMSTHNGCDARGGYSDFKIYRCDPWEMFDWDDFSAHCERCEVHAADPADTIFDEKPYVRESSGWWCHRKGEWCDPDGNYTGRDGEPIFDPNWPKPGIDLPDDFEQEGPICPIHHLNMEVS